MKDRKISLTRESKKDRHVYLEMNDLSETAVQIWEDSEGEKKTYIRIKLDESQVKKIMHDFAQINLTNANDKL